MAVTEAGWYSSSSQNGRENNHSISAVGGIFIASTITVNQHFQRLLTANRFLQVQRSHQFCN